jgi:hypothetical protein
VIFSALLMTDTRDTCDTLIVELPCMGACARFVSGAAGTGWSVFWRTGMRPLVLVSGILSLRLKTVMIAPPGFV